MYYKILNPDHKTVLKQHLFILKPNENMHIFSLLNKCFENGKLSTLALYELLFFNYSLLKKWKAINQWFRRKIFVKNRNTAVWFDFYCLLSVVHQLSNNVLYVTSVSCWCEQCYVWVQCVFWEFQKGSSCKLERRDLSRFRELSRTQASPLSTQYFSWFFLVEVWRERCC